MNVGDNIRRARKNKGLTQIDVAEMAEIAVNSLRLYEAGKRIPNLEQLQHIARAIGVEWTELVPDDQQGATIAAHVIEKGGLTVKDRNGKIIHQGSSHQLRKMSDAEAYRAGFLQFHSDEERIAYFYRLLNEDGKLAAGGYFFRHLDKNALREVADYVVSLSENSLYKRQDLPAEASADVPKDTTPESPPEGKK